MKTGWMIAATAATLMLHTPHASAQEARELTHFSVVSFVDIRNGTTTEDFLHAWGEVSGLVSQQHGHPSLVKLGGGLENAGSTDPVDLPTDYLMIARFSDEAAARAYLAASEGHHGAVALRAMLAREVSVLTTVPPGNQVPVFSSESVRREPGFLLVNPIDMQDDERAARVMEYSAAAFPLVMDRGVRFSAPFATVEVLQGSTDMDVLYITDWPDLPTFRSVHSDPRWLEVVPLRNEGVRALSDLRGHVVRLGTSHGTGG